MERTWRWFGKKDKITLAQLKQIGVEGIVTALHDVPLGRYALERGRESACSRDYQVCRTRQGRTNRGV